MKLAMICRKCKIACVTSIKSNNINDFKQKKCRICQTDLILIDNNDGFISDEHVAGWSLIEKLIGGGNTIC